MTDLIRCAVFGLFDDYTNHHVRSIQQWLTARTGNRSVLHFPVHVTIRGRILASADDAIRAFRRLSELALCNLPLIELTGPQFHDPDLTWLLIPDVTPGFRELGIMHRITDSALRPFIVRDEVSPAHAGSAFCPHVTLGWGSSKEEVALLRPISMMARMASLALVKYPPLLPINEDLAILDVINL